MKKYVIINDPLVQLNYDQLDQNSKQECVYDFLQVKYVVSYDGDMPDTILKVANKSEEYTKDEIVAILSSPNWSIYNNLSQNNLEEYYDHIKFYEEIL